MVVFFIPARRFESVTKWLLPSTANKFILNPFKSFCNAYRKFNANSQFVLSITGNRHKHTHTRKKKKKKNGEKNGFSITIANG